MTDAPTTGTPSKKKVAVDGDSKADGKTRFEVKKVGDHSAVLTMLCGR